MHNRQSDTEQSQQSDLPEVFTHKIIQAIKHKNVKCKVQEPQDSINPAQNQQEENYNQFILQQFANQVNYKVNKNDSEQNVNTRKKTVKISLPQKNIQYYRAQRKDIQPNKIQLNQNVNNVLAFQSTIKEYFEDYLTKVLRKMQIVTNSKLQQINQRIVTIQKSLPNLYPFEQAPPPKKGAYIKNKQKLQYIQKIEKGKISIEQVADTLNLKQKIVRSWMVNKQSLRQKQRSAKKQRKQQKQLNNLLL